MQLRLFDCNKFAAGRCGFNENWQHLAHAKSKVAVTESDVGVNVEELRENTALKSRFVEKPSHLAGIPGFQSTLQPSVDICDQSRITSQAPPGMGRRPMRLFIAHGLGKIPRWDLAQWAEIAHTRNDL